MSGYKMQKIHFSETFVGDNVELHSRIVKILEEYDAPVRNTCMVALVTEMMILAEMPKKEFMMMMEYFYDDLKTFSDDRENY